MERAWIVFPLVLLGACEVPSPTLPEPPATPEMRVDPVREGRLALETVAASAALDPAALWAPPQRQHPDLERILAVAPGPEWALEAVTEQTVPCPGGGTLTTIRDDQGPPWPSSGDRYTSIFQACVQGNTTLDGTRSFAFVEITGQPYVTPPWRSVTEVTRAGFTVSGPWGSQRSDGSGRITLESDDGRRQRQLSEGDWQTSREGPGQLSSARHRYRIDQQWDTVAGVTRLEFDVSSTDSQWGDVFVRTLTPLVGPMNGAPESGRVEIVRVDPSGRRLTTWIEAGRGGQAWVETDLDGDGVADQRVASSWYALGVERYLNIYF